MVGRGKALRTEGSHIVDAVLATLRQDGVAAPVYTLGGGSVAMPDLDDAEIVTLAGASAGGTGTILNADRVGDLLRAENTACQGATCDLEYDALIDSIFSPSREDYDDSTSSFCTEHGLCTYETHMTAVREPGGAGVMREALDEASCAVHHATDGDLWKCSDEGHVIRHHVTTPMFVRMGQADELISGNAIEAGFEVDGQPLDVATFARLVREEVLALTDPVNAEEGGEMTVAPGAYSPTCPKHETLSDSPSVYGVTIDEGATPTHMYDAMGDWRTGSTPVAVIATSLADDYCPP